MNSHNATLFQVFKYGVYALLTLNIFIFGREEYLAAIVQFSGGVPLGSMIEAYASTIDTAAWVVLLLMFELETYVLDDRQLTPPVSASIRIVRALCYSFILYAFYGYIVNLLFVYDTALLGSISDLCRHAANGDWSYATDLDEYTTINAANCATFTSQASLHQFGALSALVDAPGLIDIRRLAWVDVINSGVWILVVVVLEVDVWLQEQNRFTGMTVRISSRIKIVLYSILFMAAVYWGIKGDFVDFWDAFLWLLAFFFIEKNVVDWRAEGVETRGSGLHSQA